MRINHFVNRYIIFYRGPGHHNVRLHSTKVGQWSSINVSSLQDGGYSGNLPYGIDHIPHFPLPLGSVRRLLMKNNNLGPCCNWGFRQSQLELCCNWGFRQSHRETLCSWETQMDLEFKLPHVLARDNQRLNWSCDRRAVFMDLHLIIVTTECMKEVKCSWTVEASTNCFEGKIETILSRQNQLACNEFNLRVVSQVGVPWSINTHPKFLIGFLASQSIVKKRHRFSIYWHMTERYQYVRRLKLPGVHQLKKK
ncbi:hypothetical protein C5167_025031 [Papaver somniferum]|uniref:Uncharacterized protein n=1 Tax=Papaver somniferum TaxID=3469 RepID=A0A4Y7JU23_PAPSO|nr:hypothetical protein C5167_025031 [Papaver somniferum]